jgi:hypothetical protein
MLNEITTNAGVYDKLIELAFVRQAANGFNASIMLDNTSD